MLFFLNALCFSDSGESTTPGSRTVVAGSVGKMIGFPPC
jgi:hypothetical protein